MFSYKTLWLVAAVVCLSLVACDKDSPLDSHHDDDHAEAEGFIISSNASEVANYVDGKVSGVLSVTNADSVLFSIEFIAQDGDLFTPDADHHSLLIELENTDIAAVAENNTTVPWQFTLQGHSVGETTAVIKIFHGDHADFVSPPVTIQVTAAEK